MNVHDGELTAHVRITLHVKIAISLSFIHPFHLEATHGGEMK